MDYIVRLTCSATSVHVGAYPLCMCVVWYNYNIQLLPRFLGGGGRAGVIYIGGGLHGVG